MAEAVARQALEGVKVELDLTEADLRIARAEGLQVEVQAHPEMPPGSGEQPAKSGLVVINVRLK